MAFQYSLQSILRLRLSLEKQAEQNLLGASAHVAKLRNDLEQIGAAWALERKRREEILPGGAAASELHFAMLVEAALQQRLAALRARLQEAENNRTRLLALYKAARQKREILEALRQRAENAYKLGVARREQQQIDELFLRRAFLETRE